MADARDSGLDDSRKGVGGATFLETPASADELMAVPVGDLETSATRGPTAIALARLRADRGAVLGLVFIVVIVLVAICAPLLTALNGHTPNETFSDRLGESGVPLGRFGGISTDFWLGVDPGTGRDVFSRIVYGARVSLGISIGATIATVLLGMLVGSIAGFFPGKLDTTISRLMDLLLAFPGLLFLIAFISIVPDSFPRPLLIAILLTVFGFSYIGRLVRTLTLGLREREFVEAARVSGAGEWRILFREVLPNLSGPLLTYATLLIPGYIVAEVGLTYLGLGIKPPNPSWGDMLADATNWYIVDPTYLAVPGLALFFTVFAFNLFGDGVSAAFNPKSRK